MTQKASIKAPWDGEVIGEIDLADDDARERAVVRAQQAFASVRAMPGHARRDALRKIARALESRLDELATRLATEAGKPITLARAEVARVVSTFDIASEEATRSAGGVMSLDVTAAGEGYTGVWRRVPRGPVLGIAPFNFPLNLVAHKVAPALACGASIVLKPAPQTPLIALELAAIVRDSGFPEHALQVLPCDVQTAELLVRDDRFGTLSFTGSAAVGWHLKSIAGKKHVVLELGGNAAAIVHEDADLDFAAKRVVLAAFGYAGQVCIKVQRLYVHAPIADRFIESVVSAAKALVPRAPTEPGILSCLIDEKSGTRVASWVAEAKLQGARVLVDGSRDRNRLGAVVLAPVGSGQACASSMRRPLVPCSPSIRTRASMTPSRWPIARVMGFKPGSSRTHVRASNEPSSGCTLAGSWLATRRASASTRCLMAERATRASAARAYASRWTK